MKLEDQVVSLELSKKLKELRINQSSEFYWIIGGIIHRSEMMLFGIDNQYSAFTVAELLEMLPPNIHVNDKLLKLTFHKSFDTNYHEYDYYVVMYSLCKKSDKNLSNACAKLLIYLIENGLIKINDNTRLA